MPRFSQHVTRDSMTYRFCKVILPLDGFSRSMITFVFIPSPWTLTQRFVLKCEPYDPTKQILTSVIVEYATCLPPKSLGHGNLSHIGIIGNIPSCPPILSGRRCLSFTSSTITQIGGLVNFNVRIE